MRGLGRRRFAFAGLVSLAALTFVARAFAGTYLDRAGILVRQARTEIDYLSYRTGDHDLAELVHRMTVARLSAARDMSIPKEVTQAHPHLLLMLENCERAADAAETGAGQRFIIYHRRARDEEEIFRRIMRQFGFPLEDEKKKN